MGVDPEGNKHVPGIREGTTEHAEVVTSLLQDLVERGLDPKPRRLFVLDYPKCLRAAVKVVFGDDDKVQRCHNHKMRNVTGHMPKQQKAQARSTLRAAFKLEQYAG